MTVNPYEAPQHPVEPERVARTSTRPRPMIGRMTAEEVAVVGLIGLILCALMLPGISSGYPPLLWCLGLSLFVSVTVFLSGVIGVLVRWLTPAPLEPACEHTDPAPANAERGKQRTKETAICPNEHEGQ